jgi:hypothetical protein
MQIRHGVRKGKGLGIGLAALAALLFAGCGGGGGGGSSGPAIQARPQTIAFGAAPTLPLGGTATVSATASSGLSLTYSSETSSICSVDVASGVVTALTPGDLARMILRPPVALPIVCRITAVQDGDATFAPARKTQAISVYVDPNQTITFGAAPSLSLYSVAAVSATATSILPVTYSSLTPTVCTVGSSTGLVTALTMGNCTIAANQAGYSPIYNPAPQATQTIAVVPPVAITIPGASTGVTATLGAAVSEVKVSIGAVDAGGSPITGYTVTSSPAGITATGASLPITVTCPVTCVGYAFSVFATNAIGDGAASAPADVITRYRIVETFHEPATQPNDTIFTGTFSFNSTTRTVSNLKGDLTQSMTGGCATIAGCPGSYGSVPMTTVFAQYQLSSRAVTLGGVDGLLVTTFVLNTTNTFYNVGGDGWSPQWGVDVGGVYYGWPKATNPFNGGVGNSSAMIFVNTADPTVPLAQAQINMLAYADCSSGGMMGSVCMTGTSIAGYGAVGTMGGYPYSQVITKY